MLTDKLPRCLCGAHNYRPGGGHYGPNGSSQWNTCEACGRPCVIISRDMSVLAVPVEPVTDFPEAGLEYLNGPLDITMRAYGKAVEDVRAAADKAGWDLYCDMNVLPRGTKFAHVDHVRCLQRPDGSVVEDPEALKRADAYCIASYENTEFLAPPTPPQKPACLVLYVWRGEWQRVENSASWLLSVPPDPRRIAHDAAFKDIFEHLNEVLESEIIPREIPNQYHDDRNKAEPWYTFEYHGRTVVVGPRKSVISIHISVEEPFSTARLKALAVRDGVTYEADNAWQSDALTARSVLIHAWSDNKCVEYLTVGLEGT